MPLYEYLCESCQFRFEIRKSIKDRHKTKCPKCGELANLVMSIVNHTFGYRLTDASHERFGPKDEFERDI